VPDREPIEARASIHSCVRRAVRESDRPALAGATERAFGSAARQNACAWRGGVKENPGPLGLAAPPSFRDNGGRFALASTTPRPTPRRAFRASGPATPRAPLLRPGIWQLLLVGLDLPSRRRAQRMHHPAEVDEQPDPPSRSAWGWPLVRDDTGAAWKGSPGRISW
jgi:hypothetical protein